MSLFFDQYSLNTIIRGFRFTVDPRICLKKKNGHERALSHSKIV